MSPLMLLLQLLLMRPMIGTPSDFGLSFHIHLIRRRKPPPPPPEAEEVTMRAVVLQISDTIIVTADRKPVQ